MTKISIPNEDYKITLPVDLNYSLERLDTNLNDPTNQNSLSPQSY